MAVSIVLPVLTGLREDAVRKPRRRNPKRAGELAEAAFLLKAQSLGFRVLRPWGDSERYDFVLDSGGRLWRVQLKSTSVIHARGYEVLTGFTAKARVGTRRTISMFWWCGLRRWMLVMCCPFRRSRWKRICDFIRI